jgi:hypothetical protein
MKTEPLTKIEVAELIEDGHKALLVEVDGNQYNIEDVKTCCSCDTVFPDDADLDLETELCRDCAVELDEHLVYQEELRADYHAGLL